MQNARIWAALCMLTCIISSVYAQPQRDAYDNFEIDYRWLEIRDIGQPLQNLRDNDFQGPFAIGYPFPFYGQNYEHFWVSSNGFIGFGPPTQYGLANSVQLPNEATPNNIIALFWSDLDPSANWARGTVYVGMRDEKRVIQYDAVGEHNEDGIARTHTITMQIILEPDGNIVLQYKEIGEEFDLGQGVVGVENADGSAGATFYFHGDGLEIAPETAYLLSEHGPGNFLIWDAATDTPSGDAQEAALRALGHSVAHFRLANNQQLPDLNTLLQYEALFINLGNFGIDGRDRHVLTAAEGQRLAGYLQAGNGVYMEGGDTWSQDPATAAHPFFHIRGAADGRSLEPPVVGSRGSFAEGFSFQDYQAENNELVDQLEAQNGALPVFEFSAAGRQYIGMVSFLGEEYRTVGCSFEFGGLRDGENGSKEELMAAMVEFFRQPFPEFAPPLNLRATAGDREVTLQWDHPRRAQQLVPQEIIDLEHQINRLSHPRDGGKPSEQDIERIIRIRAELAELYQSHSDDPQRDEFLGFNIYVDDEEYDFTNSRTYTVFDLENNRSYDFAVSAVYVNPDGESDPAGPISVIPTGLIGPGWQEGFEDFNGALNPTPAQGGWEWGVPAIGAANGQRAWATGLNDPYPNAAFFTLSLPTVDLEEFDPNGNPIQWSFSHHYDVERDWDGGQARVSTDGQRWEVLSPVGGYPTARVFALNSSAGFSGSIDGWQRVVFNLAPYAGNRLQIKLVFASDESNFEEFDGWYIDDMRIDLPQVGSLRVRVRDDETEDPIGGALVVVEGFGQQTTFPAGHFQAGQALFANVPLGNYRVVTSKIGYINDESDAVVQEGQETVVEVFLVRWDSELAVDPEEIIDGEMAYGDRVEYGLAISNQGNSPTSYRIFLDYFLGRNANLNLDNLRPVPELPHRDEPWELIRTINLTQATGDRFCYGAEFVRDLDPLTYKFIVSAGDFRNDTCHFYLFDRDGNYLRSAKLTFTRGWGLRDLAYFPQENRVYGSYNDRINRVNPLTGALVANFRGAPLEVNRAIASVPGDNTFWVGNWDEPIYKVDQTGAIKDSYSFHGLRGISGMAWNPSDPDGACLYIHNQESENGGAALYRFNPVTRQLIRQMTTANADEGFAGGAFVTYLYDTHNYVLGVVIQGHGDGDDILKLYELWPRGGWLTISPDRGDLEGQGQTNLTVTFDAATAFDTTMSAVAYVVDEITRNAESVLCEVTVQGGAASLAGQLVLDGGDGRLSRAYCYLNNLPSIRPNNNGVFTYPRLAPGRYTLRVELVNYTPFISEPFDLAPDQASNIEVHLSPIATGMVFGHVVSVYENEQGQPIPLENVEVAFIPVGQVDNIRTARTNAEGYYEQILQTGLYNVNAFLSNWGRRTVEDVEVTVENPAEVNFTLDDRHGVIGLQTDGRHDNRVQLLWLPPGAGGTRQVLSYHNRVIANGVYLRDRDDILAVRFEPENVYDVLQLTAYTLGDTSDFGYRNSWPDVGMDNFIFYLFDEDPETGLPGNLLYQRTMTRALRGQRPGWDSTSVSNIRFLEGPLYVGWSQDPAGWGYDAVALDDEADHPGTTFANFDGGWREFDLPGDMIIQAAIWDHQREDNLLLHPHPRDVRRVAVSPLLEEIPQPVLMGAVSPPWPLPDFQIDWRSLYSLMVPPQRDERLGFQVMIDGEPAFENLLEAGVFSWDHVVGSENENQEHTYSIRTYYAGQEEPIEGVEAVGCANIAPGNPTGVTLQANNLEYTISWTPPVINADGSQCVDYRGCDIYLNDQRMAHIVDPQVQTWNGRIEAGQEGWYRLRIVAFDEVPNYSASVEYTVPVGTADIHKFEGLTDRLFIADPVNGGWTRTKATFNTAIAPHSDTTYWVTAPSVGHYQNNVQWSITTNTEFNVVTNTARLDFYQYYNMENGKDGGQVFISRNNGAWRLVEPVGGYPDQTVAALENTPGYTGRTPGWVRATIDLAEFQGSSIRLKLLFASDASLNNYAGWYLDDFAFWGCTAPAYGVLTGAVVDQDQVRVTDAYITDGRQIVKSDRNGNYTMTNVLPGATEILVTKAGFHPSVYNVNMPPGGNIQQNAVLVQARIASDPDQIQFVLGGDDHLETGFNLLNLTNVEIPFSVRLLSNPGALGQPNERGRDIRAVSAGASPYRDDPWDHKFEWNLTQRTGQRRVMGAEYAEEFFYVSSADPVNGALISILNWQGTLQGSFRQPVNVVGWGLRDLAWDGELLYGSQDRQIHGFNRNGELISTQQGGPLTVNRAVAYDPDADGFWVAEWDSPWYLVNREGQVVRTWNGHGLRGVYGLACQAENQDGIILYALNLERDGHTGVYRADPVEGVIELVHELEGAPTGCFITGAWDANFWLLGAVTGDPDTQQNLIGLELGPRIGWLNVSPTEGLLGANGGQELTLSITVPLEAEAEDVYNGEIAIHAFGAVILTIPFTAEIIEGFRHFEEPEAGDDFHTMVIESAAFEGIPISVGSEIAVFTPRGQIGGVLRWVMPPGRFPIYIHQNAFQQGERFAFRIWIPESDEEYVPVVSLIDGSAGAQVGGLSRFNLNIDLPDLQNVALSAGWNLASIFIQPDNPRVDQVLGPINERGHLVLAKDGTGRFWWPAQDYNGLNEWNVLTGYLINVTQAEVFSVEGERLPPDTPVPLLRGWNTITYLRDNPVDSRIALAPILDILIIAKDGFGNFTVPAYDFYGLGNMHPGKGYKLKMSEDAELVYQNGQEGDLAFTAEALRTTGSDMSLLITSLNEGLRCGADVRFKITTSEGLLVGESSLTGLPCGVIIRGDDIATTERDGAVEGEPLDFQLSQNGSSISIQCQGSTEAHYETDGFLVVSLELKTVEAPVDFTVLSVYPNPFNAATSLRFSLPESDVVTAQVVDLTGRTIWSKRWEEASVGWHNLTISAESWTSGVYILTVQTTRARSVQKLVVIE